MLQDLQSRLAQCVIAASESARTWLRGQRTALLMHSHHIQKLKYMWHQSIYDTCHCLMQMHRMTAQNMHKFEISEHLAQEQRTTPTLRCLVRVQTEQGIHWMAFTSFMNR
jgi:ERCC4-type nuclease